jgi:cell division protein FtsN
VAGSYNEQENADRLILLLKASGIQAIKVSQGALTRVIVAEADRFESLQTVQEQLKQQSIKTWITKSPCYQLSEEEHKANRRTDFKVIRL